MTATRRAVQGCVVSLCLVVLAMRCSVAVELSACWPDTCAEPSVDAGPVCVPTGAVERCDGLDNDCNGHTDEGVCGTCACTSWASVVALPAPVGPAADTTGAAHRIGFDGQDTLGIARQLTLPFSSVWFGRRQVDGGTIGNDRVLSSTGGVSQLIDTVWSGTHWVSAWVANDSTLVLNVVTPNGTELVSSNGSPGIELTAIAAINDDIYGGSETGTSASVQRITTAFALAGPAAKFDHLAHLVAMRAVGDAVVAVGTDTSGGMYSAVVRGDALVSEDELLPAHTAASAPASIASDGAVAMVCWGATEGIWCRPLSMLSGRPAIPAFLVSADQSVSWAMARASCDFILLTGHQLGAGAVGYSRARHFNAQGQVDALVATVDSQWVQPRPSVRLLTAADGRLIRVTEQSDGDGVVVSSLSCDLPPAATDCSTVVAAACDIACTPCPQALPGCLLSQGSGVSRGFDRAACDSKIQMTIDCSVINLEKCQLAMQKPASCSAKGWLVPSECVAPR